MQKADKLNSSVNKNRFARRAIFLAWFTIIYNVIEGVVSITFGLSEGSIALTGFGADSLIEVASAMIVLWRMKEEFWHLETMPIKKERQATFGIGILFVLLAVFTAIASGIQLFQGSHPATTVPGAFISAISLSFMFFLWSGKLKAAQSLGSSTVKKDADCSLACIKLSIVLLIGSILYWVMPSLWWTDSIAALILSYFIGREGWETVEAARDVNFTGGCGCSHEQ